MPARLLLALAGVVALAAPAAADPLPRLKVSDNKRFLVTADGKPFFWLADTAWELFHRLNREDAVRYLDKRKAQGFNVVQAVAIAELDGHSVPNAYGHLPLENLDPAKPVEEYWKHVDFVVDAANARGIYVGFLPTWGRYWHDTRPDLKPIFTRANAAAYGEWLGKRYKDKGIVWVLGGDRKVENDEQKEVVRAMARGLKAGDGGAHLSTFHPPGGDGSSTWFHADDWLDFNMRQNGHVTEFTGRYDKTRLDYDRTPTKPVIDGEPIYEGHPVSFKAKDLGHSLAADVRRPLYWDTFTGACGHTYGHHAVWQMWTPGRGPINNPLVPWTVAIDEAGANQMVHGRKLLESRPYLTRVPDDSVIVPDAVPTAIPGAGTRRFVATRDSDGTYAMVYAPVAKSFQVKTSVVRGERVTAWWYNPRTGEASRIGEFPNPGTRAFNPALTPADAGGLTDWVLVLDDAAKNYPPPGQTR